MPDGSNTSANLFFRDFPILRLDDENDLQDNEFVITYLMGSEFVVNESGSTQRLQLKKPVRLYLTPKLCIDRYYSIDAKEDSHDISTICALKQEIRQKLTLKNIMLRTQYSSIMVDMDRFSHIYKKKEANFALTDKLVRKINDLYW